MKDINYIVKREAICVGLLDKTNFARISLVYETYDLSLFTKMEIAKGLITKEEAEQAFIDDFGAPYSPFKSPTLNYVDSCSRMIDAKISRKGIIVIDENNQANDLLFDAPRYPIFNVSSDDLCLEAPISYKWTFKFDKILQYFNYPEYMTYEDVIRMKTFFLDSDFIFDYCELFGKTLCDRSGWQMPDGHGGFKFFCNLNSDEPPKIPMDYFLALYDTRLYDYRPKEYEGSVRELKKVL